MGSKTANAKRIIDDRHPACEDLLAELVEKEARFARNRRASDRAGKMAEKGQGYAGIEDDRILACLWTGRIEARDSPLPRLAAKLGRSIKVFQMASNVP